MSLVGNKCVFDMSIKGETTGKVYEGKFVIKLHPTLAQRQKIAVEYSKRNAGNTEQNDVSYINGMVAEYQVLAEEMPEWFKGSQVDNLEDLEPIVAIGREMDAAQKEYAEKLDQ